MKHFIPLDLLDELITKFLIFAPQESKINLMQKCFQIELAHWHYLDFYVPSDPSLNKCTITMFASQIFKHVPVLRRFSNNVNEVINQFEMYKQSLPTFGVIMLSEDATHVLLVQCYFPKSSWSFPKGKLKQGENPVCCAIREVYEETGFDTTNYINKNLFLESVINNRLVRLYLIMGISRNTKFVPKTQNKIRTCKWFLLADLPNSKIDYTPEGKMGINPNSFFMAMPFIERIKAISVYQLQQKQRLQESNSVYGQRSNISMKDNSKAFPRSNNGIESSKKRSSERKNLHCRPKLLRNDCAEEKDFSASIWTNFQFDMAAIME